MFIKTLFTTLALGISLATVQASAQHRPPPPHRPVPPQYRSVDVRCESIDRRYAECPVRYLRSIERVYLLRQFSRSSCSYGYSYGVRQTPYGDALWVGRGCRADFRIMGW